MAGDLDLSADLWPSIAADTFAVVSVFVGANAVPAGGCEWRVETEASASASWKVRVSNGELLPAQRATEALISFRRAIPKRFTYALAVLTLLVEHLHSYIPAQGMIFLRNRAAVAAVSHYSVPDSITSVSRELL